MAIDLTELYKQRQAIDAEIKTLREQAVREGESIVVDGVTIDAVMNIEGELPNPVKTDFFPTYRKDSNGDVIEVGEISFESLVDEFVGGAISVRDEALEAAQNFKNEVEETLAGVDEDLDSLKEDFNSHVNQKTEEAESDINGVRDQAIAEINGKLHLGYRTVIGDGTSTEFTITHNLGCEWVVTQIWYADLSKAGYFYLDEIDQNTLKITFASAPDIDGVEVRIISSERVEMAELPDNFQVGPENLSSDCYMSGDEITDIIGG